MRSINLSDEKVIECITNAGATGITRNEIASKLGYSQSPVDKKLKAIIASGKVNIASRNKGKFKYYYIQKENVRMDDPVVAPKHPEKYNKPSAVKEIKAMDSYNGVAPARVYRTGENRRYLAVRVFEDTVLGYNVANEGDSMSGTKDSIIRFNLGDKMYKISAHQLTSIGFKKLNIKAPSEMIDPTLFVDIVNHSPLASAHTVQVAVPDEHAIGKAIDQTLNDCRDMICEALGLDPRRADIRDACVVASKLNQLNVKARKDLDDTRKELSEAQTKIKELESVEPAVLEVLSNDSQLAYELEKQRADIFEGVYKDLVDVLKGTPADILN